MLLADALSLAVNAVQASAATTDVVLTRESSAGGRLTIALVTDFCSQGAPCAIASLNAGAAEVALRLIAHHSGIPYFNLFNALLLDAQWPTFFESVEYLNEHMGAHCVLLDVSATADELSMILMRDQARAQPAACVLVAEF